MAQWRNFVPDAASGLLCVEYLIAPFDRVPAKQGFSRASHTACLNNQWWKLVIHCLFVLAVVAMSMHACAIVNPCAFGSIAVVPAHPRVPAAGEGPPRGHASALTAMLGRIALI